MSTWIPREDLVAVEQLLRGHKRLSNFRTIGSGAYKIVRALPSGTTVLKHLRKEFSGREEIYLSQEYEYYESLRPSQKLLVATMQEFGPYLVQRRAWRMSHRMNSRYIGRYNRFVEHVQSKGIDFNDVGEANVGVWKPHRYRVVDLGWDH